MATNSKLGRHPKSRIGSIRRRRCPFRLEERMTDWPLQIRPDSTAADFVEAARILGGQPFGSPALWNREACNEGKCQGLLTVMFHSK